MRPYLLLTPGPLTTSETVKEAMMSDWCTWDEDYNVGIVEVIRKELVELASSRPEEYTAVLMQGSGSFCVEATLGSVVRPEDHLLVAANGAYGKRMGVIADYYHLNYHLMKFEETQQVDPRAVDAYLNEHPEVTHVSVVHCETTTGVLNPLEAIAEVVKSDNGIQVFLKNDILFATNSSELTPASMQTLTDLNRVLKKYPQNRIVVQGYTDSTGTDAINNSLSKARAKAVYDFLLGSGLKTKSITYIGYGSSNPIASNSTAAGRAQNRRVVLAITANEKDL